MNHDADFVLSGNELTWTWTCEARKRVVGRGQLKAATLHTLVLDSSLQSEVCTLQIARAYCVPILILILMLLEGWTLFLLAVQDRVPTGR